MKSYGSVWKTAKGPIFCSTISWPLSIWETPLNNTFLSFSAKFKTEMIWDSLSTLYSEKLLSCTYSIGSATRLNTISKIQIIHSTWFSLTISTWWFLAEKKNRLYWKCSSLRTARHLMNTINGLMKGYLLDRWWVLQLKGSIIYCKNRQEMPQQLTTCFVLRKLAHMRLQ